MRRAVALLALLLVLAPALGWRAPLPAAAAQDAPPVEAPAPAAVQTEPEPEVQNDPVDVPTDPPPPVEPPPVDTDGDGVADGVDNCPTVWNADQTNTFGGGLGDACEAPPPPDGDGDGIADALDNCPLAANPDQANTYGDVAGDACEAPPAPTEVPTEVPTTPTETPTTPGDPPATETPSPTPTPTPPATPTPVTLGPDDPSLFGWPSSIGGPSLAPWAQAAGYGSESAVIARIDAGGSAGMTPSGWSPDAYYYDEGKVYSRRANTAVAGADEPGLFLTERRSREDGGRVYYGVPIPEPGDYTVRLSFTARSFGDGNGGFLAGQQVLNVNLEGGTVLAGWDAYTVGGGIAGVVHTFDIAVVDGTLDIDVVALAGQAAIAAIEVVKPGNSAGEAMVEFALRHQGLPYIWATSGPNSFDCSGFTNYVTVNILGVPIGLNQLEQMNYGAAVDKADLQAGDLVFFYNTHPTVEGVSHVGIYIGNGQFVHASAGAGAVVVNDLNWGYYADHYYAAVRLV